MTKTKTNKNESSPRIGLRGLAKDLAWDADADAFTTERLNEEIAVFKFQAEENKSQSLASDGSALKSLEEVITDQSKQIASLTKMIDSQQAALLFLFSNKGEDAAKALDLLSRVTGRLVETRQLPPAKTLDANLKRIADKLKRRDVDDQHRIESERAIEPDLSPKQQGRELGS